MDMMVFRRILSCSRLVLKVEDGRFRELRSILNWMNQRVRSANDSVLLLLLPPLRRQVGGDGLVKEGKKKENEGEVKCMDAASF